MAIKRQQSFASNITIRIMWVVFVIIILIIAFAAYLTSRNAQQESRKLAISNLQVAAESIERNINSIESSTLMLIPIASETETPGRQIEGMLESVYDTYDFINEISITFEYGHFKERPYYGPFFKRSHDGSKVKDDWGATFSDNDPDQNEKEYKRVFSVVNSIAQTSRWSPPSYSTGKSDNSYASCFIPAKDNDGHTFAYVEIDITLDWIIAELADIHPYKGTEAMLLHKDFNTFYIPDADDRLLCLNNNGYVSELDSTIMVNLTEEQGIFRSGNALWAYSKLSNGWILALNYPYSEVYKPVYTLLLILFLDLIIGLILLFFFTRRIIYKQAQPITDFTLAAESIATGNFNTVLPEVNSKDEILLLHDALDNMQHSLSNYVDNLQKTTAENERYSSELNIASNIQMSMLNTKFPTGNNFSIFARTNPAKEVGGDLYDCQLIGDKLFFLVGDVSGKGVPASLYMSLTMYSARLLSEFNMSMGETMTRLNDSISKGNSTNMFVTLFIGCIDLNTGKMTYCNGGHNPIVIVNPNGSPRYLKEASTNLVCGVMEGMPFKEDCLQLEKGSRLVIYTDGVTEAFNTNDEEYGEPRLLDTIHKSGPECTDREMVCDIMNSVKEYAGKAPQSDDITVMSVSWARSNR